MLAALIWWVTRVVEGVHKARPATIRYFAQRGSPYVTAERNTVEMAPKKSPKKSPAKKATPKKVIKKPTPVKATPKRKAAPSPPA